MTESAKAASAYFRAAPPRLECTRHGLALVAALRAALGQLDELRSKLATERAMRREGP